MQNNYEATKLHFENLRARYGNPIIILNLIKVSLPSYSGVAASCHCICTWMIIFCMLLLWLSLLFTWKTRERRESILRREFDKAIKIINKSLSEENHLRFLHWDLHQNSQGYFFFSNSSLLYFSFPISLFGSVCYWCSSVSENLQMYSMSFWKWHFGLWIWPTSSIVKSHQVLRLPHNGPLYCKAFSPILVWFTLCCMLPPESILFFFEKLICFLIHALQEWSWSIFMWWQQ